MLIIAQPKSASTSLLFTLAKMMKIKPFKGTKRKSFHILEEGFEYIQKYHTLAFERSPIDVKEMIERKDILYREHLLPCKRVFKILDKYNNYIVLLRKPIDSYDNYCRLTKNFNEKLLLRDLEIFNSMYREYLKGKDILIINYEDLVLKYNETMNKIKSYWKIKSKIIPLQKQNYTGEGIKRLKNA